MADNSIKKEVVKGALTVDSEPYVSNFQKKGTMTAQLRQVVTTKSFYPSARVSNSLNDNPFSATEFGDDFVDQEFESVENRIAWIDVPVGTTKAQVEAKLASNPKAGLYRILSNKPILSNTDLSAIAAENLDVTKDTFANKQVVRYPMGHEQEGQIALDSDGNVQYRRIALSMTGKEDEDLRDGETYVSPEIEAELGIAKSQIEAQVLQPLH